MVQDARFEDGAEQPLRLLAVDSDDLGVISALVQDAVLPATEMQLVPSQRRFAMLLNRFRWEDRENAAMQGRKYERVQSLLLIEDVIKASFSGIHPDDKDEVLSVLDIGFAPADTPAGTVTITFAGYGAVALQVECLEIMLKDVTRPYLAPSAAAPQHSLDED